MAAALRRGCNAAVVATFVLLSPAALADPTYGGVPAGGTEPWRPSPSGSGPSQPSSASAGARRAGEEPAVHFVGFFGYDIGSTRLVSATLSDGSKKTMDANQGFDVSVGIAFLKLFDGALATQATIGWEGWWINASNGSVEWRAFPLDVMEYAYLGPLRVGSGISYLISPKISGSGVASAIDVSFKNSLGFAVGADWVLRFSNSARRSRMTLGGRYVWQDLQPKDGRRSVSANSFAILLGFTG